MLRKLNLETHYRSDRHRLLYDFFEPCLAQASDYDRAVGYFTSSSLAAAARGLRAFLDQGGRMRIVASPYLTDEDIQAIRAGYERREWIIQRALLRSLADPDVPDPIRRRLEFLAWLVAQGRLDIKIALREAPNAQVGVYHEKVGIFRDASNDTVVFTGSANESVGGLMANFEALEVFCSWRAEDAPRVQRWVTDFEALWANRTSGLAVYPFPEAARRELLDRYRPSSDPEAYERDELSLVEVRSPFGIPALPSHLSLRDYQKQAVKAWFANNGEGVWEMATGTGKTFTALAAITQLHRHLHSRGRGLAVVVVCPFQHLVAQWAEAAEVFGIQAVRCMGSRHDWSGSLGDALHAVSAGQLPFVLVVATNQTFAGEAFQAHLTVFGRDLLFVADEMHNLGAPRLRAALPSHARYRLGLSATPERHLDEVGTSALAEYFGPSVFQLDLADAIRMGALVPYRYYPVQVPLTDAEQAVYVDLTAKISRFAASSTLSLDIEEAPGPLQTLMFARARLLGSAAGKLEQLGALMRPLSATTHNLVYCADGQGARDAQQGPQLDGAIRLLGAELGMRVNSYTHETPLAQREELRARFANGDLQALVAIRCLDEGVDIPETHRGFLLASTTNPRQFVQRRGRLLRPSPGKQQAELYDFVVVPPDVGDDPKLFKVERRLVARELARVVAMCKAATNGPEALRTLLDLRRRYRLLDL